MKQLNKLSKNIISVIVVGLAGTAADIICAYLGCNAVISSIIGLIYTVSVCFLLTVILSEDISIFSQREKGKKLLSRASVIRLIAAFIISVVLSSSFVVRLFTGGLADIVAVSVVSGIISAVRWIAIYIVMTVKNADRKGICGLIAVSAVALVFSVVSQYITGIRTYNSLQNAGGTLLGYLSALSVDMLSLVVVNTADIFIMCAMVLAAHFFRKEISVNIKS